MKFYYQSIKVSKINLDTKLLESDLKNVIMKTNKFKLVAKNNKKQNTQN
jgi:hypothetical protein